MSVSAPDDRITTYNPVVPTTDFPALFPVFDNADISVYLDEVERTDFTVSATYVEGVSNNAVVKFSPGITGHVDVVGAREPRRSNRFGAGPIPPRDLNLAFDSIEAEMQEAHRDYKRTHKAPYSEEGGVFNAADIENAQANAEAAAEASQTALDALSQILGMVPNAFPVTRAEMKALPTTIVKAAYLKEAGREGQFLWLTGDFSSQITADTTEGIYIKADGIASTAGAWVRVATGEYFAGWFGVKADGVTDDTTALQAALNMVSMRGGGKLRLRSGSHKISAPLDYVPKVVVGDPITGSDLLFASCPVFELIGTGNSEIVAAAAMPHMFRITFGSGEPSPNQCKLENVALNGAGLATIGVLSEWCLGTTIKRSRIFDIDTGVKIYGRGGSLICDNFIRAKTGIHLTRGGDTVIERNHIFLKGAAGALRTAAYLGAWGGNSRFTDNTVQAEQTDNVDHVNTRGVWLDGTVSDTVGADVAKGVRDVLVGGNEFHGIQVCVLAVSDTLALNTGVCTVHVVNNHAMQGWWPSTQLVYAQKVVNLIVSGNYHNIVGTNSVNLAAAQFDGCIDVDFRNNQVSNVSGTNAVLVTSSSDDVRIEENVFVNAVLTAGQPVVFVQNSNYTRVRKNVFKQYSVYTTICVGESGTTAVGNDFRDNDFAASYTVPYSTSNANTIARRVEYRTWSPPDASWGTWRVGDVIYLIGPTAGGSIGFVCTAAGAPGTWKSWGGIAA